MKRNFIYTAIIFMGMFFVQCKHSPDTDLIVIPPPPPDCDSVNVTYAQTIKPIIEANCFSGCHNGQNPLSGVLLETYEQVKAKTDTGTLMVRITQNPSSSFAPMPPAPAERLSTCQIGQFQRWIDLNYPQ
jgi:hypothetical protein